VRQTIRPPILQYLKPAVGSVVRPGAGSETRRPAVRRHVVTIRVPLREQRDASYDIAIGPGLLAELPALLKRHAPAAAYAIISDSHVAKLYGDDAVRRVSGTGYRAELLTFPAGEWNKTRETWASLSDRMLAAHFGRDCAVIALGAAWWATWRGSWRPPICAESPMCRSPRPFGDDRFLHRRQDRPSTCRRGRT